MRRIYVDVDTQFDFCDPRGALFVNGAPEAVRQCERLVRAAVSRNEPIVGSVDSHAHDAWEFSTNDRRGPKGEKPNFPPHCVKGTPGWLKLSSTLPERFVFVGADASEPRVPDDTQAVYFEKEVYSLFANPNATRWLDRIAAREAVEFVVFGVATDYCVRAAALGLLDWSSQRVERAPAANVIVVHDAIAGVAKDTTEAALREMTDARIRFARCDELVR